MYSQNTLSKIRKFSNTQAKRWEILFHSNTKNFQNDVVWQYHKLSLKKMKVCKDYMAICCRSCGANLGVEIVSIKRWALKICLRGFTAQPWEL